MFRLVVVVVGLCFTSAADRTEPAGGSWFVAAVYEHSVVLNPEPRTPLSRPAALRHMHDNLRVFEQQAALAAQQVCSRQKSGLLTSRERLYLCALRRLYS